MNRLDKFLVFFINAVLEGGFWYGLASFLSILIPATLSGYFLFGLLVSFAYTILIIGIGLAVGGGLGISLGIVNRFFFQQPEDRISWYRFVVAIIALIVTCPIAFFTLKSYLEGISATGQISLEFLVILVTAAMIISVFISQRLASRYIKSKAEKAKNSDLI